MRYDFSASIFRPPEQEDATTLFGDQHLRSLKVLINVLTILLPAITLALLARGGPNALTWVATGLTVVALVCQAMMRRGKHDWVPPLMIFGILLAGIGGTVAHGTASSGAVLVMIAALVASGVYLSHRAVVACATVTVGSLAAINWAERKGLMTHNVLTSDWPLWLTQSAVLISLLVMVFSGRDRLQIAYRNQGIALAQWERIAEALGESQARFMALFHSNPAAVLVQSEDTGYVLDANAAFIDMFGFSIESMRGLAPPQLWHGADDQQALQKSLLQDNCIKGQRVRACRTDGSAFDAMVYAEFVTQGSERLVITMVLDVSAETQARVELEKSKERFSKAFNFSPLGMTITRMSDGMFLEVNEANERVLGYPREYFMNKTSVAAGVWVSEADRHSYINALESHGRLMGYETRMRRKQGDPVDVKIWAERIELDNEPCNLAFTLNVSEEKRKADLLMSVARGVSAQTGEAFFQSLVEQLVLAIGAHGVVVAELTERGQLASLALACNGQPMIDLEGEPLEGTLGSNGLWFGHLNADDAPVLCPDPTAPPMQSFAGVALRDDDGTAIGLLGAFWHEHVDLTDNMQALMTIFASRCNAELLRLYRDRDLQKLQATLEQRVVDRTAELELLNRELDTFAYSVSHDLKSPLRSIDGFMHLLHEQARDRCTPDDLMLMSRVMGSAQRMHSLINDLLALARVSQTQLQRSKVNLSEIAEEVIRQERHRDPEHRVEVVIAPNLFADCDARLAQIVLENLLGNAWKYSHKVMQPRIEFGKVPCPIDGTLYFSVRDNGAGFEMSRSDRLFKPFTRLHHPSEFQGSGIGLATVRRIIERHGGEIAGEGVVGEGATFRFLFGREKRGHQKF
jgi:PAS domain S-box-containing protein